MKRILLLIFLAACSAFATPTWLATAYSTGGGCFATSCSITLPSQPASSLTIAIVTVLTPYTGGGVTDSANGPGAPYTCTGFTTSPGTTRQTAFCYLPNSIGSAGTVTYTLTPTGSTGNVGMYIGVFTYSGVATASPVDIMSANSAISGNTNSFITPSITTTNASDLVFAWVFANAGSSTTNPLAVGSPFTLRVVAANTTTGGGEDIVSSTGTFQTTFTNTGNTASSGVTGIVAFKAAPAMIFPVGMIY